MKIKWTLIFLGLGLIAYLVYAYYSKIQFDQTKISQPTVIIEDYSFPDVTIRALDVIDDHTVWFAGSKGVWGYTLNGGTDWHIDTIAGANELRSIKVTPNGDVYIVNVTKPAVVYKSIDKGRIWETVYTDTSKDAFFDGVNFWNDYQGVVLGDAVNHCFHFARTTDAGKTWQRVECDSIPPALSGENPFATSNSNIELGTTSAWIPTGGENQSRVFYTHNRGISWGVTPTPIMNGGKMTGIFTIDFLNDSIGVVGGGNWEEVTMEGTNLAITHNGGMSWERLDHTGNSGYISAVKFIPNTDGRYLITLSGRRIEGESRLSLYDFTMRTWTSHENTKSYISIKSVSKNRAWLSGNGWIGKLDIKL